MSHITESELAALQESNLGRSTPFSISGVSHGQLSVASAVERIVGPLPGLIDAAAKRAQCGRDEVLTAYENPTKSKEIG